MKNVCTVLIGVVLVLIFGGCESRYEELAKNLKAEMIHCDNLKLPLPAFIRDHHALYYEEITKMSASEYNKLMKTMGCNLEKYSLEVQIEELKKKLAELEETYAKEGEYKYSVFGVSRAQSIEYMKTTIKELESK
jgi:hypothetical protein